MNGELWAMHEEFLSSNGCTKVACLFVLINELMKLEIEEVTDF